jgi:hypothetical protein
MQLSTRPLYQIGRIGDICGKLLENIHSLPGDPVSGKGIN